MYDPSPQSKGLELALLQWEEIAVVILIVGIVIYVESIEESKAALANPEVQSSLSANAAQLAVAGCWIRFIAILIFAITPTIRLNQQLSNPQTAQAPTVGPNTMITVGSWISALGALISCIGQTKKAAIPVPQITLI